MNLARLWPLAACAAALGAAAVGGCSSILGIPSGGSLSFCARPENQGHDYCEDYDVGDSLRRVGPNVVTSGMSTMSLEPSDASPPNLIDFLTHAAPPDAGHEVSGYYKTFENKPFVGLRLEADMKFITNGAGIQGALGFMLIGASPGACLGLAAAPWPLDAGLPVGTPVFAGVYVPQSSQGCASLIGLGAAGGQDLGSIIVPDGGAGPEGGIVLPPIVPAVDGWFHLTIQIAPSGDGSGVMLLRAGLSSEELALPKTAIPPTGLPIVGFAAAPGQGGIGEEVQFDNVTVDVARQQLPPPGQ